MSMVKLISPGSWSFGDRVSQMVKLSSRGLVGGDLAEFVKRAGHQFADALRRVDFHPGEVPIHLIAIGSTEAYGANRNGDGFKEAACRRYHPTFVTRPSVKEGAYWFRNHKNKDPQRSYGVVKLSAYNEAMRRIELVAALNGTKEAAARNGGLIADQELEKLARGDDNWGVSMACTVPFDVCSGCGNRARSRAEYCTEATCKYGGLRDHITRVAEDGHLLHADNTDPRFFDISDVGRPADRIAWVLGHAKAASYQPLGGAALAEAWGVSCPYRVLTAGMLPAVAEQIKLAYTMAEFESKWNAEPLAAVSNLNRAFDTALQPSVEGLTPLNKTATGRAQVLEALAGQKVVLPIKDFLCLITGEESDKLASLSAQAARRLPGVYSRLLTDDNLEDQVRNNPYAAGQALAPFEVRRWAEKQAADHSLATNHVERRVMRSALRDLTLPTIQVTASTENEPPAEIAARQYALYKLAIAQRWAASPDVDRLCELLVRHNYLTRG